MHVQKNLVASFVCLAFAFTAASGQTTHSVQVSSNVFSPSELTISAGDIVEWTNTGGSHNVNGTQAAYPSNPESFGNSVGSGWVYSFTFTTPGTYDYHCDPHVSFGMVGKVIVEDVSTWTSLETTADWDIRPNPVVNQVTIRATTPLASVSVYSTTGRLVFRQDEISVAELKISMVNEGPGIYLINARSRDGAFASRSFVKK